MKTIYKYPIARENNNTPFELELPEGAEFLYFQVDPKIDSPCAWFLIDTERQNVKKTYYMAGTGWTVPYKTAMFLGSCIDGPYVWHLFKPLE